MALLGTMVLMPSPCRKGRSRTERSHGRQQMQPHVILPLPQDNHSAEHQAYCKQMHLHCLAPSAGKAAHPVKYPGSHMEVSFGPGKAQAARRGLQHRPGSRPRCPPRQAWAAATCRREGPCLRLMPLPKPGVLQDKSPSSARNVSLAQCSQAATLLLCRIPFWAHARACWACNQTRTMIKQKSMHALMSVLGSSLTCAPGL